MSNDLKKIIQEKAKEGELYEVIKIESFSTWFNPNCAVVISKNRWRILFLEQQEYVVSLFIYESDLGCLEEKLFFKKMSRHSNLEETEKNVKEMRSGLNNRNPILPLSHFFTREEVHGGFGGGHGGIATVSYFDFSNILKFEAPSSINPDDYIRKLDIIKRQIVGTPFWHYAIYLGEKKVVHIVGKNNNNGKVMIEDWGKFLAESPVVGVYHPIIPFKEPKLVIENIKKSLQSNYGENSYNLLSKNCQHFSSLCVYGIDYSEESDAKPNLNSKKISEGKAVFDNMKIKRPLEFNEEVILEQLQAQIEIPSK